MSEIIWTKEKHPDWFYDTPNMKTLIIGSFPPYKTKRNYDFYYPNKQNRFWKILASIALHELKYFEGKEAVNERQGILRKLKVGLQDMGKIIRRKNKSSLDSDIIIEEYFDIIELLKTHPKVQTILISGFSAKNSPYGAFKRYYEEKSGEVLPNKVKALDEFFITTPRKIRCMIVNSTSPLVFKVTLESMVEQFSKYIKPR